MKEDPKIWLKEGKQSKTTKSIRALAKLFSGDDFEKIKAILKWMDKNIKSCRENKKILKIFAKRTISKILKDKFSTGCHDDALIFVVFSRILGIPAKYVAGIDKLDPKNKGHCVAEIYIGKDWVLVDPSEKTIDLDLKRSNFYKENFLIGKGLDSWDIGIKSFRSWKDKSNKIIKIISKVR